MGMFDWIDYVGPCQKCGRLLNNWQSKDGPCEMKKLKPFQVSSFYDMCDNCNTWNEFTVEITPKALDFIASNFHTKPYREGDGKGVMFFALNKEDEDLISTERGREV